MGKTFIKKISLVSMAIVMFTLSYLPAVQASYTENPNGVYYELSRQVYNVKGDGSHSSIESALNSKLGKGKFKVIDTIDVNEQNYHKAGTSSSSGKILPLDKTGFQAMTVVIEGSKKLYIAFSGSQSFSDYNTAKNIMEDDIPGQLYQAQLYANYIYKNFPQYQGYKWYFTGHSLGGWLATKLYLDIRAANWVIPTTSKYKYGGPIGKKTINGVYTFNPLPIRKGQHLPQTQWDANKNGVYNQDIKNLYIENEWLNGVYDMHSTEINYFGTKGSINTGIKSYSTLGYKPNSLLFDVGYYYNWCDRKQQAVVDGHSIYNFTKYVQY
ncbi:alpha/beta hydrolase family protein [Priestia megaterium]|uniref:hypothetical protein n=1 Tax=Priestia megaterium TaxID=1404 RepID=UPI00196A8813|nr:hypothetical protein [Priestia megaterium]QSF41530.1 hypothetical protein ICR96_12990 [Priestia megaterium]